MADFIFIIAENTIVVFGDYVTRITNGMFRNLGISDIAIPNSVKSIGITAFAHCEKLTSIAIPSSVESISINAFVNCTSLSAVEFQASEKPLQVGCQIIDFGADYEYGTFYVY